MFDNCNPIAKAFIMARDRGGPRIYEKRTQFIDQFRSYIQTSDLLAQLGSSHSALLRKKDSLSLESQ